MYFPLSKRSAEGLCPFAGDLGLSLSFRFLKSEEHRKLKKLSRGAGYLLPGAWGCPPIFTSPKTGGHRGLIKAFNGGK
jgi:hypothetical protein